MASPPHSSTPSPSFPLSPSSRRRPPRSPSLPGDKQPKITKTESDVDFSSEDEAVVSKIKVPWLHKELKMYDNMNFKEMTEEQIQAQADLCKKIQKEKSQYLTLQDHGVEELFEEDMQRKIIPKAKKKKNIDEEQPKAKKKTKKIAEEEQTGGNQV